MTSRTGDSIHEYRDIVNTKGAAIAPREADFFRLDREPTRRERAAREMTPFASNLRRLIARLGLTVEQAAARCQVDLRTVKAILAGDHQPQARTLHRLAVGLEVPVDELFQDPSLLLHRIFDRRTNPLVTQVVEEHPDLFAGWNEADFDDLYSRFGEGGALTTDGVIETATCMAFKRLVHQKLALLLETNEAELVSDLIDLMYQRALVKQPPAPRAMTSACH